LFHRNRGRNNLLSFSPRPSVQNGMNGFPRASWLAPTAMAQFQERELARIPG
jgi:hypothetical protein